MRGCMSAKICGFFLFSIIFFFFFKFKHIFYSNNVPYKWDVMCRDLAWQYGCCLQIDLILADTINIRYIVYFYHLTHHIWCRIFKSDEGFSHNVRRLTIRVFTYHYYLHQTYSCSKSRQNSFARKISINIYTHVAVVGVIVAGSNSNVLLYSLVWFY